MKDFLNNATTRIGFMQGRLSPLEKGRIQSFPWFSWRDEFEIADNLNFSKMEWTIDQDRLYENPLMSEDGRADILLLSKKFGTQIPSLTGDCFMQDPFWKTSGNKREALLSDFRSVVSACAELMIRLIVVPLVDNGRIENAEQERNLISCLKEMIPFLNSNKVKIIFESDYSPLILARFINNFDPNVFGINYDIGNSAALGFDPLEEIMGYGQHIVNVHVKDRVLGGSTTPLGLGDAEFDKVFSSLAKVGYSKNYILQTARATDSNHCGVINKYRNMTVEWINLYGA